MESEETFTRLKIPSSTPLGYQTLKVKESISELGIYLQKDLIIPTFLDSLNFFEGFKVIKKESLHLLPIKTINTKVVIVTRKLPDFSKPGSGYRALAIGDILRRQMLLDTLESMGYERVDYVEKPGEYSVRGGIVDIYPETEAHPIRIEFMGDEILSIRVFREDTQKTIKKIDKIFIPGNIFAPEITLIEVEEKKEDFVKPLPPIYRDFKELVAAMHNFVSRGYHVFFYTVEKERAKRYAEFLPSYIEVGLVEEGFVDYKSKKAVFTELMLFPLYRKKRKTKHSRTEIQRTFQKGEYVVHLDYGIAKFDGLVRCKAFGKEYDCARLVFQDGILDVPSYNLHLVERFNVDSPKVNLSYLSKDTWKRRKLRIELRAYKLAREILQIHARRKKIRKKPYKPVPEIEGHIALDFPYLETEDQKKAIKEVLNDLSSEHLMDRLIAGDVGFGKTEVAIRACARVVANSKQVLILVPTTPLALQHYNLFKKRLEKYGINVCMASRFVKKRELSLIKEKVKNGICDILISTHYVLRNDFYFKNLGLLIIDEEHKFGVKDKELLRKKYPHIDTLRLTATPIPRTLNMSLGKIYDLSIIETPPIGREEVETYVGIIDEDVIKKAISFELERGGKVFYIHNRIHDLPEIAKRLQRLLPHVKLSVAHGKLPSTALERILTDFYTGETEVLLSTAIMEAGVDFPMANTIIVENAHLFGLSDLHQLRGRVGRSDKKGYAYFLVPKRISREALKRLDILKRYHHLGAGFQIALKDLELRGAGNLLGKEQHGFIETIGPSMFFKLLEMAISELEGKKYREIELRYNVPAFIPESYIKDDTTRVGFYNQISEAKDIERLNEIKEELKDRFGRLPCELETFIYGMKLKVLFGQQPMVQEIVIEKDGVKIVTDKRETLTFRKLSPKNLLNLFLEITEDTLKQNHDS